MPIFLKNLIPLLILAVGFAVGWFSNSGQEVSIQNVREESAGYKFINPLLFVKTPEESSFPQYSPLKESISSYIDKEIEQKKLIASSVYFRDLNSSKWVNINPNDTFTLASMSKVLTLISVLRAAESDPRFRSANVEIDGKDDLLVAKQTYYPVNNPIRVGRTYTIEDLIEHLIVESDNVANVALMQIVGEDRIFKTYDDLQLPRPIISNSESYTGRQYSHLFRALYNGTYLSRSVSEQVLELLSRTKFDKGIVAGVPSDIVVSHKYGVHMGKTEINKLPGIPSDSNDQIFGELHDCGIVYHPKNPYFICVMTRGYDLPTLESVIKNISQITWNQVNELTSK